MFVHSMYCIVWFVRNSIIKLRYLIIDPIFSISQPYPILDKRGICLPFVGNAKKSYKYYLKLSFLFKLTYLNSDNLRTVSTKAYNHLFDMANLAIFLT